MIISNPTRHTRLIDENLQVIDCNPKDFLSFDLLRNASWDNHIYNSRFMVQRPDKHKPVLDGLIPLPPRSRWYYSDGKFSPIRRSKNLTQLNNEKIKKNIQKLANTLSNSNLAIESSGGLDCSLVIGALMSYQVDPVLVGVVSDRYEFRTERIIQENIGKTVSKWIPIQEDLTLPFSDLNYVPPHLLPNKSSLFYKYPLETMRICKKNNIKIILNGMGFDTILIDKINESNLIPTNWHPWSHEDSWFNEYVYRPNGIDYRSASSVWRIIEIIYCLREGLEEDPQKKWARRYFSNWLPLELSDFTYKADGLRVFISGIESNEESILELCRRSYSVNMDQRISPNQILTLITRESQFDDKNQLELMSRISFAVWINSRLSNQTFSN